MQSELARGSDDTLHSRGWKALDGRPQWSVLEFCEAQHDQWFAVAVEVLEQLKHTWYEYERHDDRPGEVTAVAANKILRARGSRLWISTTHPSVEEDFPWQVTGPRWYCSLITSALDADGGCCVDGLAPPPPEDLQRLLWPDGSDATRPWITELGFTLVPGGSDPQMLHADIVSHGFCAGSHRTSCGWADTITSWKAASATARCTTTEIAAGYFTNGIQPDEAYESLRSHRSPCLILDSEVLHRGASTPGRLKDWSSTCTIQLCSTSGWGALAQGGRCSEELRRYVIPIATTLPPSPFGTSAAAITPPGTQGHAQGMPLSSPPPPSPSARHTRFDESGEPLTVGMATTTSAVSPGTLDPPASMIAAAAVLPTASSPSTSVTASPPTSSPSSGTSPRPVSTPDWEAAATKRTLAASLLWSNRAPSAEQAAASLRAPGWLGLPAGLPRHWAWAIFSFVEALHEEYAGTISRCLAAALEAEEAAGCAHKLGHRSSVSGGERPGERAAAEVTAQLHRRGVAISVYAGPPSQAQAPPYAASGPRFYVSVTQLALEAFPEGAPPMPPQLRQALWPHAPDAAGLARVRGLGWALAPPGSDPQLLHADLWGRREKRMPRFPHVIWKRGFTTNATTQLVPSGFTRGQADAEHYAALAQEAAPALIFDSEILHRGAATQPAAAQGGVAGCSGSHGAGWVSSCSVELCSFSGWEEWERGTGGTEFNDAPEWRMLPICMSAI